MHAHEKAQSDQFYGFSKLFKIQDDRETGFPMVLERSSKYVHIACLARLFPESESPLYLQKRCGCGEQPCSAW